MMPTPRTDWVQGQASWQQVDFLSDVHLDAREASTFEAWRHYLNHTQADALFILGDLFEMWVGDDTPHVFELTCLDLLEAVSQRLAVYVMHGNRDFLLGTQRPYSFTLLDDPTVLALSGEGFDHRFLLSHGDAWCLQDTAYQQLRTQVRGPAWQQGFLAQDWATRYAIGQSMRQQSMAHHAQTKVDADVDTSAALTALAQHQCTTLIHGHTHRPALHQLDDLHTRWVLSDWHADASPARLEVIQWKRSAARNATQGLERHTLQTSA